LQTATVSIGEEWRVAADSDKPAVASARTSMKSRPAKIPAAFCRPEKKKAGAEMLRAGR